MPQLNSSEIASPVRRWSADFQQDVLAVRDNNSVGYRLARGAGWSLFGAAISQGSAMLAAIVTARLLGTVGFGELGMVQNTVGLFGTLAGMGLGMTATKFVAQFRSTVPERAAGIIRLSRRVAVVSACLIALVLVVVAPVLASSALKAPHLSATLQLAALWLLLNTLTGTQTGVLAGLEAFQTIARVSLIRGVLALPVTVVGVHFWALDGVMGSLAVTAAAAWLLNERAIRSECRRSGIILSTGSPAPDWKILWSFSVPAFLSSLMAGPALWAASAILVNRPNGYAELGVFNAASQWRVAVAFVPAMLAQPLLSMLSQVGGSGDSASYRRLLTTSVVVSLAVSLLIGGTVCAGSAWIMDAYGASFRQGRQMLNLLVLSVAISAPASVVGHALASQNRMWWGFSLNVLWTAVLVTGSAVLVPKFGALGLTYAYLASYMTHAASSFYVLCRILRGGRAFPCDASFVHASLATGCAPSRTGW